MDEACRIGIEANRARWDEAAPLHAISDFYDLDGFRSGRDDLHPFELDELGTPVAGLDLVHLQCHLGTDTLSWARQGANVVGLDFSAPAIEAATALAADCGLPAEFVCADVYDAAAVLGRSFDVVYTGIGALNWLPDIVGWAEVAASLLRPGGVVYLVEIHPLVVGVVHDGRTIGEDLLDASYERWDDEGGTYAAPDENLANTVTYEKVHAVSEVGSALLGAGLTLELLHEHAVSKAPWPWCERGTDGLYRLPAGWPRYPLTYSLRARRPADGERALDEASAMRGSGWEGDLEEMRRGRKFTST